MVENLKLVLPIYAAEKILLPMEFLIFVFRLRKTIPLIEYDKHTENNFFKL